MNIYYFNTIRALENADFYTYKLLMYDLKLYALGSFIKNKFKDKRSIPELVNIIKEEYFKECKTI